MQENSNSDGKQLFGKQRLNYINILNESYKILGSSLNFNDDIFQSTRARWTSFESAMKYWELYDEKEEYL